jgi:NADP-dependent 3-hydroxy acid dehydrogenase YdfG
MTKSVALVIGASRGLGFSLAIELAKLGYHVVCVARTVGGLEELDDKIIEENGTATLAPLDINNSAALKNLCYNIFERWGKIDILVHSAVFAAPLSPVEHIDKADLNKSLSTNIVATQEIISMTHPLLSQSKKPTAVFFSDKQSSNKFFGSYGSTKDAQYRLAQAWKKENEYKLLNVLILEPKPMSTSSRARFHPGENKKQLTTPSEEAKRLIKKVIQASAS